MAFPAKLLNQGETVVVSTRTHPKALIFPVLIGIVVVAAAILLSILSGEILALQIGIWVIAAGAVFWWVAKSGRTIPLNRISGVDFELGVIDRVFGCGTLVVSDQLHRLSAGERDHRDDGS